MRSSQAILLTGGTGYVGGRLIPLLETRNEFLRCVARDPTHLKPRVGPRTDVVRGDLLDAESLRAAFDGIDTAFYLVHSMGSGSDFEQSDRQAAENFAAAARQAGVRRIIYLGGLGESQDDCRRICVAVRKWVISCARREFKCWNFAPRSSLVPGVCRSN